MPVKLLSSKVSFGLLSLKGISFSCENGLVYPNTKISNNSVVIDFLTDCLPPADLTTLIVFVGLLCFSSGFYYYFYVYLLDQKALAVANRLIEIGLEQKFQEAVKEVAYKYGEPWRYSQAATDLIVEFIKNTTYTSTFPS